jgi:hypothetical protein
MRIVGKHPEGAERKAWDARQWLKDHASHGPHRAPRRQPRKGKTSGGGMTTITVQAVICGLIILAVFMLKALNIPQTQEALAGLDQALTTETDLDRALGRGWTRRSRRKRSLTEHWAG